MDEHNTAALALSYQLNFARGTMVLFIAIAIMTSLIARRRTRHSLTPWALKSMRSVLAAIAYGLLLLQLPKLSYALAVGSNNYLNQVSKETGIVFALLAIALVTLGIASFIIPRLQTPAKATTEPQP